MKTFITIMLVLFLSPVEAQLYGAYDNGSEEEVYNPGTYYTLGSSGEIYSDPNSPFQKTHSKSRSNRISGGMGGMYKIQERKARETEGTWIENRTQNKYRDATRRWSRRTGGLGTFGGLESADSSFMR